MRYTTSIAIVAMMIVSGCHSAQTRTAAHHDGAAAGADALSPVIAGNPLRAAPFKVFTVYTDRSPRHTHYAPSGYMGDSDLTLAGAYAMTPHGQGPCLKVIYGASGPKGWAGIYWQDPANNWGEIPGRAGFDLRGAVRLTFWARGENGGERIHEVRTGGIVGQYPDSDVASLSNIRLTKEWKPYVIDLSKKDLRHIIGGFAFFVSKAENPGGAVFFLDDIVFEGQDGDVGTLSEPMAAPTMNGQVPSSASTENAAPLVPPAAPVLKDMSVKTVDEGLKVSFSSQFLFASGRAELEAGSEKILNQFISLLSAYPTNSVLIEGHTDSRGRANHNLKLSELRAISVRNYLVKRGGFDIARFKVVGYGATRPVGDNSTAPGRLLNRRVEVTILKSAHE